MWTNKGVGRTLCGLFFESFTYRCASSISGRGPNGCSAELETHDFDPEISGVPQLQLQLQQLHVQRLIGSFTHLGAAGSGEFQFNAHHAASHTPLPPASTTRPQNIPLEIEAPSLDTTLPCRDGIHRRVFQSLPRPGCVTAVAPERDARVGSSPSSASPFTCRRRGETRVRASVRN